MSEIIPIKGLTLHQPWAELMAQGVKKIETRSWQRAYRGWLAISASKAFPTEYQEQCECIPFEQYITPSELSFGKILCVVHLQGIYPTGYLLNKGWVKRDSDEFAFGNYDSGRFGWVTERCIRLQEPIPCRGYQSLWDLPEDVMAKLWPQIKDHL